MPNPATSRAARWDRTKARWWQTAHKFCPPDIVDDAEADDAARRDWVARGRPEDEFPRTPSHLALLIAIAEVLAERGYITLASHPDAEAAEAALAADRARLRRYWAAAIDLARHSDPTAAEILARRADRPTVIDRLRQREAEDRPAA